MRKRGLTPPEGERTWVRVLVQGHTAGSGENLLPAPKDACWGRGLASCPPWYWLPGGLCRDREAAPWDREGRESSSTGESCCWSIKRMEQGIGPGCRESAQEGVTSPAGPSPLQ